MKMRFKYSKISKSNSDLILQYASDTLGAFYIKSKCPFDSDFNFPDGEYKIRGNKKGIRKEYYCINSVWIEYPDCDNDRYFEAAKYNQYSCLKESEWDSLKNVGYKFLSKYWKFALFAHENSGYGHFVLKQKLSHNKLREKMGLKLVNKNKKQTIPFFKF